MDRNIQALLEVNRQLIAARQVYNQARKDFSAFAGLKSQQSADVDVDAIHLRWELAESKMEECLDLIEAWTNGQDIILAKLQNGQ